MILHGINMVFKRPPYAPDADGLRRRRRGVPGGRGLQRGARRRDLHGGRAAPGVYDDAYLDRIAHDRRRRSRRTGSSRCSTSTRTSTTSASRARAGRTGRCMDDGLPAEPKSGFPNNYLVMPALQRAFDHFCANDGPALQDRYAAAWAHVAQRFARRRRTCSATTCSTSRGRATSWQDCVNPTGCPAIRRQARGVRPARARRDPRRRPARRSSGTSRTCCSTRAPARSVKALGDANVGFASTTTASPPSSRAPIRPARSPTTSSSSTRWTTSRRPRRRCC